MASIYRERGKFTVSWFDSKHKRHFVRGLASRALAEQIGTQRELGKTLAKHRLITSDLERYSAEADRTVDEHVNEYGAWLKGQGKTQKYVDETVGFIGRVFSVAGIGRIDQMDRNKIETAIASLKPGKSLGKYARLSFRSRNKALSACRSFGYWLADVAHRIPAPPLRRVRGWDVKQDKRRRRVQPTEEQIMRLVETTATQPRRGGMTGIDRMMRYVLGFQTGLRQGSLFSLKPESFDLGSRLIHIEATNTKNRKDASVPISAELADMLAPWLATKPRRKPVFPKLPYADPMIAYRHDLAAAGITYHEEDSILYCDQHAQRGTFITAVIRTAGLKVAQDLAHHSTPVLTSEYAQMGISDYAKALDGLPKVRRQSPVPRERAG